jgi:4-hydroxy-3-methylbut-2-enyl diphosphate reductase IspH
VMLFSQTTMSLREYSKIADLIKEGMKSKGISDTDTYLKVHNTICAQVSGREPHLRSLRKNMI